MEEEIIFTGQPERLAECLHSIGVALNEIHACLLELEHNRKVVASLKSKVYGPR